MHQSFSFGRILGVKVGANWSVIVILWLIAWSLADERFPVVAPGYSTTSYWISGVLAAVTFFMCLLAHELAHSVVARRYDVHLEGIVLWLFGGVSKFTGDPPSAQAELKIAAAGPATSMGIAVGFFVDPPGRRRGRLGLGGCSARLVGLVQRQPGGVQPGAGLPVGWRAGAARGCGVAMGTSAVPRPVPRTPGGSLPTC